MKLVLDTCVRKLATLPNPTNPAVIILELVLRGGVECWASPAVLVEYADVLADTPDFLASVSEIASVCHPLNQLEIIRHEPDNRFIECALAAGADYLVTVNTRRGHFDRKTYDCVHVVTSGEFLNLAEAQSRLRRFLYMSAPET